MMTHARSSFLAVFAFAFTSVALAQTPCPSAPLSDHGTSVDGKPLLSPPAMASATIGSTSIMVHYSAPSVRCRKIFGGVVPYGQEWRTGANPATSFVTSGPLTIGALTIPAGSYTIFTLPAAPGTPWMFIVSTKTGEWGIPYPAGSDLGRTPMMGATLSSPQEVMSIGFEKTTGKSTQLHIKWETADEWVKIVAQ
jgi:hypothetical protein